MSDYRRRFDAARDPNAARNSLGINAATTSSGGLVELATAAEMQTGTDATRAPSVLAVRDGTGAGWSSFSAYLNVDQIGVTSGALTTIVFDTEVYDIGANFTSGIWTPPAGKVEMKAAFLATGTITAGATVACVIAKNGSSFKQLGLPARTNAAASHVSIDDVANGTDTYEVKASVTTSAGTATIVGLPNVTFFMGHMIN